MTQTNTPGGDQPPRVKPEKGPLTVQHPIERERWLAEALSRATPLTPEQRDRLRVALAPMRAAS